MDGESLRVAIVAATGSLFGLWLLSSFLFRVSGVWERVGDDEELERKTERVALAQLGPFVRGKRQHPGGEQEFSGWLIGRTLRLNRRDHGVAALVHGGFPRPIAEKLDGEVMAKLTLKLSGDVLEGRFHPIKVSYTHQPPRITAMVAQPAVPRRYRRVAPTAAPEISELVEPEELQPS
jgi:hypothetical protein